MAEKQQGRRGRKGGYLENKERDSRVSKVRCGLDWQRRWQAASLAPWAKALKVLGLVQVRAFGGGMTSGTASFEFPFIHPMPGIGEPLSGRFVLLLFL